MSGNILGIGIIVILALCLWRGYAHGLFRTAVVVAAFLAAMFLSSRACPYVSDFLQKNTNVDEKIGSYITRQLQLDPAQTYETKNEQMIQIDQLPCPEALKLAIVNHNNAEVYTGLNVQGFQDYLVQYLTCIVRNCIAYVLVQLLLTAGVVALFCVSKTLSEIPILHGIERAGGLLLGALEGLAIIWVLFICISLIGNTPLGVQAYAQISGNPILNYLYEHNWLLNTITGIAGLF